MNAAFDLRTQIQIGASTLLAVTTGTAVFVPGKFNIVDLYCPDMLTILDVWAISGVLIIVHLQYCLNIVDLSWPDMLTFSDVWTISKLLTISNMLTTCALIHV